MIEALLQAERLLVHGMVDQAERIYATALEQDPMNAIAVVGLARVALERGDDELAYQHARRALELDPQNAAAARLDARLAEVLTARDAATGSPVPDNAPADATDGEASSTPAVGTDARPSEQYVFNRNPSMTQHRESEERRSREREGG
jgi:tetratricopeptide (TPR) repeat protein